MVLQRCVKRDYRIGQGLAELDETMEGSVRPDYVGDVRDFLLMPKSRLVSLAFMDLRFS